ncbi:MAG: Na+/H+ antiporter NhaA [Saprospiraceae bacterium]|nr:MAG: Na(+)/H(+) antiporter NhaA [Bacteroidetes bacterium OLB9]MCO6462526.1 Na+/H+ antiporter NhaA [Saprospiraceae bacterium]MCZ2338230.1 Na+/H+ antiporter NhaA [Chitinophagales bacterium]
MAFRPTKLFKQFFESEQSGGIILIICTVLSLLLANSSLASDYHHFWSQKIGKESLEFWINDGLMVIFFLFVGLELKREILIGELSDLKKAMLPVIGAFGGIIIPAVIFSIFNYHTDTQSGAGIPMATDIAFALGVLSLLGNRVPFALKVFLTALAVIDDLGAILVIALFYSSDMDWISLSISLGIFGGLLLLNKFNVNKLWVYIIGGIFMWYFMLYSGVHATITGVLLAFAIPFGKGDNSLSHRLEKTLSNPVPFFILPMFALANTAITLEGSLADVMAHSYSIGIAAGLVIGKPIGIFLFSYIGTLLGYTQLPKGTSWKALFSVGILGGIGFTMSIFISLLAYDDIHIINNSKLSILISSTIAAILGLLALKMVLPKNNKSIA